MAPTRQELILQFMLVLASNLDEVDVTNSILTKNNATQTFEQAAVLADKYLSNLL